MKKVVVVLSGGLDSSTLLYWARDRGLEVHALTVLYGQRHAREVEAAREVARLAGVPHIVADIRGASECLAGSALTGTGEVPHGHYADESMKATVVPNRNMVLLALAIAYAVRIGARKVLYGAHAGDHTIYPDCRPAFYWAMNQAAQTCDWEPINISAPFGSWTKREVAALARELGVPIEKTWSCYEGGAEPCGKCGTCVERAEALA